MILHKQVSKKQEAKQAKIEWLQKHLKSVDFAEIHIVPYGTPKETIVQNPNGILFDDEEPNRNNWVGTAYDVNNIIEVLKSVAQTLFYFGLLLTKW